jgi:hypothetical protein
MAIGEEMKSKYPGGEWKTINGHHVYLMENGEIAPETPLPGEDHSSKSNQHLAHDHAKLFDSITDWIDGLPDHPMTHDINMDNMQETFDMAQLAKQLQKKAKGEDFAIWVAKSDSDKFQKLSEYADKVLGVDSTDFMIQLYDSAQDKSNDQEGPGDDEEDLQVDDSYLDQDEAEPGIEPLLEEAKGYAQESKDINDFYDHLPEELSLKLIKHFNGDQDGFVKLFNEVKGIKKEPLQEFLDAHPKLSPLAKMALTHDAKEAQNYYEWQDMLLDSTFDELYNLAAQEATDGNLSETLKHMYTLGHGEPKADDYVTAPPKTPWGQVLQQAVGKTYSDWINNLSGDELDALVDYAYSHKPDGTEQHEYINKLYEDAQNGHYRPRL